MMLNPSFRATLCTTLALTVLAIAGSAALSTPAAAEAKQKDVAAACRRTKGCWMGDGGAYGCSPHACWICNDKGKCHQARSSEVDRLKYNPAAGGAIGNLTSPSRTRANDTIIHRGSTAPVTLGAPGNNPVTLGAPGNNLVTPGAPGNNPVRTGTRR